MFLAVLAVMERRPPRLVQAVGLLEVVAAAYFIVVALQWFRSVGGFLDLWRGSSPLGLGIIFSLIFHLGVISRPVFHMFFACGFFLGSASVVQLATFMSLRFFFTPFLDGLPAFARLSNLLTMTSSISVLYSVARRNVREYFGIL